MSRSAPAPATLPRVVLRKDAERRLRRGHPWVFSNELADDGARGDLVAGAPVTVVSAGGRGQGSFFFHPHSLIAARRYTRENDQIPDADFWRRRLVVAARRRAAFFDAPWHRLAHAEADGLPGAVIDRFGDDFVIRTESAGMERVRGDLVRAIQDEFRPRAIVARDDAPLRLLEGLSSSVSVPFGADDLPSRVWVPEGGLRFAADLLRGQKTGWFYDQSPQRLRVSSLARHRRVLDLYCGTGAFALHALAGGAVSAVAVDRSADALALAAESAEAAGLASGLSLHEDEVFRAARALIDAGEVFDFVIADPPAFAPRRRDRPQALRAYRKLARFCARLAGREGLILISSCSHHISASEFREAVSGGCADVQRSARLMYFGGAGADHPVLLALPESSYLKAALLSL
ncbi:MAG: class I SAM-dependent rRNA methyltransferase [Alphaproteobacteria bacterium]|nr:class I SAM-dependent rRNA methyltransferase [Alphaproteobacteria bacterium]